MQHHSDLRGMGDAGCCDYLATAFCSAMKNFCGVKYDDHIVAMVFHRLCGSRLLLLIHAPAESLSNNFDDFYHSKHIF